MTMLSAALTAASAAACATRAEPDFSAERMKAHASVRSPS